MKSHGPVDRAADYHLAPLPPGNRGCYSRGACWSFGSRAAVGAVCPECLFDQLAELPALNPRAFTVLGDEGRVDPERDLLAPRGWTVLRVGRATSPGLDAMRSLRRRRPIRPHLPRVLRSHVRLGRLNRLLRPRRNQPAEDTADAFEPFLSMTALH